MKKKKIEFSKVLCTISLLVFVIVCIIAVKQSSEGYATDIYNYIVSLSGGVTTGSIVFYLNKAKAENLSKQRIRYVLMKLLLEDKIDGESYKEVCNEIDNIDEMVNTKINSMLNESIEKDVEINS